MSKVCFTDDAELYAHRAWERLGLEPPVDLRLVADRLGIVVEEREFAEEIDGIYLRLPGAPPIVAVNSVYLKPPERRRFTLAHEIGHHLLSSRFANGKRLFFLDTDRTRRTLAERACDRFAAMLLMPEHLVRRFYAELEHNPSYRLSILSVRFGVSEWAMRRRLRELGLPIRTRRTFR